MSLTCAPCSKKQLGRRIGCNNYFSPIRFVQTVDRPDVRVIERGEHLRFNGGSAPRAQGSRVGDLSPEPKRDAEQALPKSRARATSLSNYLSSERAKAPYGLISLAYRDIRDPRSLHTNRSRAQFRNKA
jgi:hypothetical protein